MENRVWNEDPSRSAQSDLSAHQHAMSIPVGEVVKELVGILGATTVAVIGGVKETRAVQQWCEGREPQRAHVLRFALQLACLQAKRTASLPSPGFTAATRTSTTAFRCCFCACDHSRRFRLRCCAPPERSFQNR